MSVQRAENIELRSADSLGARVPRPAPTTYEPSSIFALKSLLYPCGATLTLFLLCLAWNQPIFGPNFVFGALVFVVVANFFGPAPIAPLSSDG